MKTRQNQQSLLCRAGIALFMVMVSGCGGRGDAPPLAPATGVVTYQGQPLADAIVSFAPESGPVATGRTDSQGHFSLSVRGESGAVLGGHRVAITAVKEQSSASDTVNSNDDSPVKKNSSDPVSRIPTKYGNFQTSGLTATVAAKPAENQFVFELK